MSLARWFGRFLGSAAFGERGAEGDRFPRAIHGNKLYLKRICAASVEDFLSETTAREFFPEALLRIAWHAAQSHRIFSSAERSTHWPRELPKSCVAACGRERGPVSWASARRGSKWLTAIGRGRFTATQFVAAKKHASSSVSQRNTRSTWAAALLNGNSAADLWMLAHVGSPVGPNVPRETFQLRPCAAGGRGRDQSDGGRRRCQS